MLPLAGLDSKVCSGESLIEFVDGHSFGGGFIQDGIRGDVSAGKPVDGGQTAVYGDCPGVTG